MSQTDVSAAKNIVVIGCGVMGAGITQVMALAGHNVWAVDIDPKVLDAAKIDVDTGRYGLKRAVDRGKTTEAEANAALARIDFILDEGKAREAAVAKADFVIEAIPERIELKIQLFMELDNAAPRDCILASNSSGFSISALGAATQRPEKVVGWHWGSPPPVIKLAEIVRGVHTSDETIQAVSELAAGAKKNPIVINDAPQHWGYITNRVYFAMIREAQLAIKEGVATAEEVDQLMIDGFRWPTGPFGMVAGAGSGWN